ncbi:MAG: hypothetical protein HXY41_15105 [Chloroflexi bacterium]|nr:hypothetical protein [Chloroflexota bacterium]
MTTSDLTTLFLIGLALACIVPLIILGVMAVFLLTVGRRALNDFFDPDSASLRRYYERLRTDNPHLPADRLLARVIGRQSFRCGVVGAITGLGGFITLPIALPVDIVLSLRMQAILVDFIAELYGQGQVSERERQLRHYLILAGGRRLSEAAFEVAMKFALRVLGKSLAKLVPFIGAAVSFALNYAMVQGVGRLALARYARPANS